MKNSKNGQKFGKLLVIQDIDNKKMLCRCDCGVEKIMWKWNVILGNTSSCGCYGKEVSRISCKKISQSNKQENGSNLVIQTYWGSLLRNAKSRDIIVSITPKYMENLFIQQNQKCALTGLDITLPKNSQDCRKCLFTASIDRINSNHGYIEKNVQWIHKDLQDMKWDKSQNDFILWCHKVANHNPI